MKIKKKLLSLLLAAALILSLMPSVTLTAWAASDESTYTFDISEGDISVSQGSSDDTITVTYGGGSTTMADIPCTQELTIIGTSNDIDYKDAVTVASDISDEVNITLSDVNIDMHSYDEYCAFSIGTGSTVNLTLTGDNTLISGTKYCAGLRVPSNATLNISGEGSLTATAGINGAGIGGDKSCANCGKVTISSGSVTAKGGGNGAGIGGGYAGSGGTVTISGTAEVYATGGDYAAGIGGGQKGSGGKVIINGGSITANGGKRAAGIGGGYTSASGDITINGGTVNAIGSTADCSTGIGSGTDESGNTYTDSGSVTINGGKITASGKTYDIVSSTVTVSADDSENPTLLICGNSSAIYSEVSNTFESGSIEASTATLTPTNGTSDVYLTTVILPDSPENAEVTYSTDGGATKYYTYTDASGNLYLWLPAGDEAVQVTGDDWSYKLAGTVAADNSSVFTVLTIDTDSLANGVIGAYTATLSASGGTGPYTWSAEGLPDTLTLDSSTGKIIGKPTDAGTYTVKVTVTDSNSITATATYTLQINACGNGAYLIVSDGDDAYTDSYTDDGLLELTVNSGVTGFSYFGVDISPVTGHDLTEVCVFVQTRSGAQIGISAIEADFDTVSAAKVAFNVKVGDVITVYIVDGLSNDADANPNVL